MMSTGDKTLAIILGASDWPKFETLKDSASVAFKNSADRLKHYLISMNGLSLPRPNLLDLFDTDDAPGEIIEQMKSFIRKHTEWNRLLFYYIGHGAYINDEHYCLAIRCTNSESKDATLFKIIWLADIFSELAQNKDNLIILDACYSGAAYGYINDSPVNRLDKYLRRSVAGNTVLYCACGPMRQAKIGAEYTMFSGSLIKVLETGCDGNSPHLSLETVVNRVRSDLEATFGDDAVVPEIYGPSYQGEGDCYKYLNLPYFPNPVVRMSESDIRLFRIEAALADIKNSVGAIESSLRELQHVCEQRPEKENFYRRVAILYGDAVIPERVFQYNLDHIRRLGGYAANAERALQIHLYNSQMRAYWVSVQTKYDIINLFKDSEYRDTIRFSILPDRFNEDVEIGKIKSFRIGKQEHIDFDCVITQQGYDAPFPICIKEGSSSTFVFEYDIWWACDEEQSAFTRRYVQKFSMIVENRSRVVPGIMDLSNAKTTTLSYNGKYTFETMNDVNEGKTIFRCKLLEPKK